MRRLGERIRKRRETLKLALNDLAKKVGITPSALSQIENAKTFPSIVTLKAIAEQLRTTVGELIGENEMMEKNLIIKKNDIKLFEKCGDNIEIFLLSQPDASKYMDAYLIRLPAHVKMDAEIFHQLLPKAHHQIFCHILCGNFVIILNEVEYSLEEGDNVYFTQGMFEEMSNTTDKIGEILWVVSPSKL